MSKDELEQIRRNQILDAAQAAFAARGIDRTRMDDIVSASGLSKGALYWYYKSKDAIIHALLDRVFGREIKRVQSLVEGEGPAGERIQMFVRSIIEEIRRFEPLMSLGYEFFAMAARSAGARASLQEYYRQYTDLLAQLIQQGIDGGEFRPLDAREVALVVGGAFEGLALFWFLDPDSVDWKQMEQSALSLLLDGLRAREK